MRNYEYPTVTEIITPRHRITRDDFIDGLVAGVDSGSLTLDKPELVETFTPEQQETEQELWLREASWAIRNMIQSWAEE